MSFFCPTEEQVRAQVLALLPRGRAWQTNEGGPIQGFDAAFNPEAFHNEAFAVTSRKKSVLWQYWAAFANIMWYLQKRLCDLRMEFWCATHNETHDGWMTEYGLPDNCDPFPDLCTKVAALGGTRCEYYQFIAQRAGWALECDVFDPCGSLPGCGGASRAGRFRPGRRGGARVLIRVDLPNSPAFGGILSPIPKAGRMKAGRRLGCGPDLSPLECLLARVVHAEIEIHYEVIT